MSNRSPPLAPLSLSDGTVRSEEERALDKQIRILEKRQRLAQLQASLASPAPPDPVPACPAFVVQPAPLRFSDIEYEVLPFSSNVVYDARKWLSDFERACDAVSADDQFRFICMRGLMKAGSDAELFLRTNNSRTYSDLRTSFLENFGQEYDPTWEVMQRMERARFDPAKQTPMGYVLMMQELASRADLKESSVVYAIVDGFRESTDAAAVLFQARTLKELKAAIPRFAQMLKP